MRYLITSKVLFLMFVKSKRICGLKTRSKIELKIKIKKND